MQSVSNEIGVLCFAPLSPISPTTRCDWPSGPALRPISAHPFCSQGTRRTTFPSVPSKHLVSLSLTDESSVQSLPDSEQPSDVPKDVFASFDALIDSIEEDLENNLDSDSTDNALSPSERFRRKRDLERQKQLEQLKNRQKQRLEILTSLPSEFVIENVQDKCPGCGAALQSESPDHPGYLPDKLLSTSNKTNFAEASQHSPVCQRCFRLTHYGDINPKLRVFTRSAIQKARKAHGQGLSSSSLPSLAPSTDLTPGKFRQCLEQLQSLNAIVIYLVDIFDFHGTFIPNLRNIIGHKCPLLLAVNKIDLLPKDHNVSRLEKWILHECRTFGVHDIDAVHFISSSRGTGVSALLADAIQLARRRHADVYVVGAANVGKSSFINQLIRRHKSSSQKGKISVPPSNSIQHSQSETDDADPTDRDEDSLSKDRITAESEQTDSNTGQNDLNDLNDSSDIQVASSNTSLTSASKEPRQYRYLKAMEKQDALTTSVVPGTTLDVVKIVLGKGVNLFDTPGLMVTHQLTNLLNEKDLRLVVPSKNVEKVTLRFGESKALYIGGLARIEVLNGKPFFFTCFFSSSVKLHLGKVDDAKLFTQRHVGKMLTPPTSADDFARLGEWTSKTVTVDGDGWKRASMDVVLSGLGWVSLTGAGSIQIKIWAPKDVGVFTREPLMPYELSTGVSTYTGTRAVNKKKPRAQRRGDEDNEFNDFL